MANGLTRALASLAQWILKHAVIGIPFHSTFIGCNVNWTFKVSGGGIRNVTKMLFRYIEKIKTRAPGGRQFFLGKPI